MNTSTNITQILRRGMAGALLAAAVSVGFAATSHADDAPAPDFGGLARTGPGCQTDPWGFLGSQRRTLCDGPISADGSWSRERTIWVPAHYSMRICTSHNFGSSYSSSYTDCSGGYMVNEHLVSDESYPVRPETVLSDEPGHLG